MLLGVTILSQLICLVGASITPAYLQEVRDRFTPKEEVYWTFKEHAKQPYMLLPLLGFCLTFVFPIAALSRSLPLIDFRKSSPTLLVALVSAFSVYFAFCVWWRLPETVLALLPVLGLGYLGLRDLP